MPPLSRIEVETRHHSHSNRVPLFPLEYTRHFFARVSPAKRERKNVSCIPVGKAGRDLKASDAVFLPLYLVCYVSLCYVCYVMPRLWL